MKHIKGYNDFNYVLESVNDYSNTISKTSDPKKAEIINNNIKAIIKVMKEEGLTDNNAMIGFLCVMGKESGFQNVRETTKNLPDDEAWLKRAFPILKDYVGSSVKLKNTREKTFYDLVYGPDTAPGKEFGHTDSDGYKYRGGGYTQLTGKKYYEASGFKDPKEIETPEGAAKALKASIKAYTNYKPKSTKFKTPQEAVTYFIKKVAGSSGNFQDGYKKSISLMDLFFKKNGKYVLPV